MSSETDDWLDVVWPVGVVAGAIAFFGIWLALGLSCGLLGWLLGWLPASLFGVAAGLFWPSIVFVSLMAVGGVYAISDATGHWPKVRAAVSIAQDWWVDSLEADIAAAGAYLAAIDAALEEEQKATAAGATKASQAGR